MSQLISRFLLPEAVDDQERWATIRLLRTIVILTLIAVVAVLVSDGIIGGRPQIIAALVPLSVLMLISIFLLGRGILWPARLLVPVAMFAVFTYLIAIGGGIHDVAMLAYTAVLVMASLTLGPDAPLVFGVSVIIAIVTIGVLEINGLIVNQGSFITTWDELVLMSIEVLAIVGLQRILIGRLNAGLRRARESEQAQRDANEELRELQVVLESRVDERTRELAQRTTYLEAIAQIGREATAVLELGQLLSRVANLVSQQFGFAHVGFYLLDESGEWAELRAASSEGQTVAREHRLPLDSRSIIGDVASQGRARIVVDASADPTFVRSPDLPGTRSQMALPLQARGRIIGVLDIQSPEAEAFTDRDVATLQTLADQIALAISNAQLFQQTQASVEAERRAYGELSRQAWAQLIQSRAGVAYRSRQGVVSALSDQQAEEPEGRGLPTLDIPIRVRGQVIGTVQARKPDAADEWRLDESGLVEVLAEQLGATLERARLYQDTQRSAARERAIADVTSRMREPLELEDVLRIAASEIRQVLDLDTLAVHLTVPEANEDSA